MSKDKNHFNEQISLDSRVYIDYIFKLIILMLNFPFIKSSNAFVMFLLTDSIRTKCWQTHFQETEWRRQVKGLTRLFLCMSSEQYPEMKP